MDNIIEPLRQYAVSVDELHLDPSNARVHDERNLSSICQSLNEFGQRQVIVVRKASNTVVAGNGRLEAARKLGWTHIAAVFVDENEVQAARYAIADNRTSELSHWEPENLRAILEAIKTDFGEVESIGFSDDEFNALMGVSAEDLEYLNDNDETLEPLEINDEILGKIEVVCPAIDRGDVFEKIKETFQGREDIIIK